MVSSGFQIILCPYVPLYPKTGFYQVIFHGKVNRLILSDSSFVKTTSYIFVKTPFSNENFTVFNATTRGAGERVKSCRCVTMRPEFGSWSTNLTSWEWSHECQHPRARRERIRGRRLLGLTELKV